MKYLSVCSGIEAASVAWKNLNWKPIAFSEIEPFPCAVLAHHYPDILNLGDMTKCEDWEIKDDVELLVGGTPCQSFSIAGKRNGMDDERGKLAIKFFEIVRKYKPRWIVWENVAGVLISNKGRNFGKFLHTMAECGYGFAYRIFDSQYFNVPQRRKRLFVVGYFGDWRCSSAVLFESQNCIRYTAEDRNKEKEIADNNTIFVEKNSCTRIEQPFKVANTLTRRMQKGFNTLLDEGQTPILSMKPILNENKEVGRELSLRRLTPIECERLQGFPDNYTRIAWKSKKIEKCPDTQRYEALGNSMPVPVMRWIGERINFIDNYKSITKKL